MKLACIISVFILIFSAPVFASGNLTIRGTSTALSFINTNTSAAFLNLSLNVTPSSGDGTVNITVVNVTISLTFAGNVSGNISAVEIRNSTGASFGSNSTNTTASKFLIALPNGFFVNSTANATMTIVVNVSRTATRYSFVAVNITANNEIGTSSAADNITIPSTYINSTNAQVQDLHANASVTPRFADTNVINQTFNYTLTLAGADRFNNITITLPSGYNITNVTVVRHGSSELFNASGIQDAALLAPAFSASQIFINYSSGFFNPVLISFNANTSSSPVSSSAFTSTITGSNLTSIAADAVNGNQTNVTTKVLANATDIVASKTVAIVNGTDYWEFNLTINITEPVSGLLQFKMTNWNNTAGSSIALVSGNTSLATLRKDSNFNTTNKISIGNDYNITDGLNYQSTSGLITVILRQVIPSGTTISQTWFATYSLLFRTT